MLPLFTAPLATCPDRTEPLEWCAQEMLPEPMFPELTAASPTRPLTIPPDVLPIRPLTRWNWLI